ncbi:hypothetical protein [Brevundimonas sp.]|uniref:hypothetical protein n=1 Tax=Brevundimonas sp. TaxID=1871086 RepID=UPI0035666C0F
MTAYRLSELIDVGFGNPSVLIPCFVTDGSNGCFVQQVTADGTVEYMKEIVGQPYPRVVSGFPALGINLRGQALFAVRWIDLTLKIGTINEMKSLSWSHTDLEHWPFFALDSAIVFGGDENTALARAAATLGDQGSSWLKIEKSARRSMKRDQALDTTPDELLAALQDLDKLEVGPWARRWTHMWGKYRGHPVLAKYAFDWISTSTYHSPKHALILGILLKSTDSKLSRTALEIGRNWLAKRSWKRGTWARVWLKIIPFEPDDSSLIELAFQYLEDMALPGADVAFPGDWPRLWRWLWDEELDQDILYQLALTALGRGGRSRRFFKSVTTALLASDAPRVRQIVFEWMVSSPNFGPGWADTCEYFLTDPDRRDQAMPLAIDYLFNFDNKDTRGWPNLWLAVVEKNGGTDELLLISDRWITQAAQKLARWPDILHRRLQLGEIDDHVRMIALQWIDDHNHHPYANMIANELSTEHAAARGKSDPLPLVKL